MRTTVDLPEQLMRAAKLQAAQRGESLKDLFTRAVLRELGTTDRGRSGGRLVLPLIARGAKPEVEVTNVDIEAALEREDVDRYGQ